jgi:hypothetical protein
MLSDEAYAVLLKHKRKHESFSDVVKRLVPPVIKTFGDLEKHLDNLEGPQSQCCVNSWNSCVFQLSACLTREEAERQAVGHDHENPSVGVRSILCRMLGHHHWLGGAESFAGGEVAE